MEVTVRPMRAGDLEAVQRVATAAFAGLEASTGVPEPPPPPAELARVRYEHPLATDPGGCWVGERHGEVTGAAMAIMREGVWGLSLLAVDPAHQSAGLGRALLARAAAYGEGARGRIILSSPDPRALTAYLGLGLRLLPATAASGVPRPLEVPPSIRPGTAEDADLIAELGRAVRGAAHGGDVDALVAGGHELLVDPGRGFATRGRASVSLLAARDEEAAAGLLRATLAASGDGGIRVEWMTADQQWAIEVCHAAGLTFVLDWGALLTGGDVGPMAPYLPSGAYL